MLRGNDVHEIEGTKQMGLSVSAISEIIGYDRKNYSEVLAEPRGGAGISADLFVGNGVKSRKS